MCMQGLKFSDLFFRTVDCTGNIEKVRMITHVTLEKGSSLNTVKPVLNGHPRDPLHCPLNRGVRLVQVHFTENKGRKIGLY